MKSFQALFEYFDLMKEELEIAVADLDEQSLGRGKFLKAKRELRSQKRFRMLDKITSGITPQVISEWESERRSRLPSELADFLLYSNGFRGDTFYIYNLSTLNAARKNQEVMVNIDRLFSENYFFMFEFAREHKVPIGVWFNKDSDLFGCVFAHDLVDRKVYLIAGSLKDFFDSIAVRLVNGDEPKFLEASDNMELGKHKEYYPFLMEPNKTVWDSDAFFRN